MAKLIKNGRVYLGGGGSSSKNAKDIKYDNSNSNLESTNIQDAIDEIYENGGSGSSVDNDIELTKAEYEALSEEEKMNGNNYFITDVEENEISRATTLTQAEYDSLPEEEKNNGVYFITDADNNSSLDILDSLEKIEANEDEGRIAGALALKEVKQKQDEMDTLQKIAIEKVTNQYLDFNDNSCYCYEKNGICYLQIVATVLGSYSGWVEIAKIPVKQIDDSNVFFASTNNSSASTSQSWLRVGPDGKIYATAVGPVNSAFLGNCAFPCKYL